MITKNIKLYLGDGFPVRIPVSQYDTMWQFVFTIVHNSQPWQIPTGATAVLNGKKPDGNVFAFSGTIANNTVTVDADVQMTAVAGQTVCELSILADGKTVGTANFILDVEEAPKSADDVVSDTVLDGYGMMVTNAVDGWLNSHSGQIGGLTNEAKQALLTLLARVAYTDDLGQTYLDALETALYPPANLVSISAVFNQGQNTIYDTDTLDDLKQYLTVTANMSDGTTQTVTNYTLSGTLTEGTSTITASYGEKTATFDVVVTARDRISDYVQDGLVHQYDGINNTGSGHNSSATSWKDLVGSLDFTTLTGTTWGTDGLDFAGTNSQYVSTANNLEEQDAMTIEMVIAPEATGTQLLGTFSAYDANKSKRFVFYSDNTVGFVGTSGKTYSNSGAAITDIQTMAAVYSGYTISAGYINNTAVALSNNTHSLRRSNRDFIVLGNADSDDTSKYPYTGKIMALRIYNRALTVEELAQNHSVDVARFGLGV